MVDLIGIEPMTSSMPFRRVSEHGWRASDRLRHRTAATMRGLRGFVAFCVCLSDTLRDGETAVGMGGL